ncbi:MAG: metallophosphoesterase [Planctomycetes bacterium]|nr:metallophosphoesterase [Planctomycetota bacterium]
MIRDSAFTLCVALALVAPACASPRPEDPAATHPIPRFEIPPAKKDVTYVRTLVFGDWGSGTKSQKQTAAAMVLRIKRSDGPPNFVLTTGDNFYPSGAKSADDPIWKAYYEKIYAAKEFDVPWRPTLGNHDYKGSIQGQIDYSKKNKRWDLPARYYSFSEKLDGGHTVEFFAIDTTPLGWRKEDTKQLAWLVSALAKSKARWKVVFGHNPMYSHSKRPYNRTLIRRLGPIFKRHKVDLYLAGHDHVLELTKPIEGVHYVVSGAGGGPMKAYPAYWTDKSYYAATRGGFAWLRISKDELVIEFCRMKGETQFAHVLIKGRSGAF